MKNLLFLPLLIMLASCSPEEKQSEELMLDRPNIVWISAEDVSPRMACYGDSTIPTPNIDRLAKEGILYRHTYTPAGVCSPTRHAIITGMYQMSTGGHNMRTQGNTYPEQTGLPKEYSVVVPAEVKGFPEYLRAAGYYVTNNRKEDYQFKAPLSMWNESSPKATFRNRPNDKPFFSVFNFTTTHESQIWKRAENPMRADPASVVLPPYYPDNEISRTDVARHYSNISELDDQVGEIMQQLEDDGLLDNTIVFFWGDHGDGLPFYKREIYKRGTHIPLIVRYPNGYNAGTEDTEMHNAIDFGPTVLSLAGVDVPEHMHGRAFLGTQKEASRDYIFGARDRLDSEYDRVRSVLNKKYQFIKNFSPEKPLYMNVAYRKQMATMRMLLEQKEKGTLTKEQMFWFKETKDQEEFYDLEKDPYQLTNLINEPEHKEEIDKMRAALLAWIDEVGDLGATPEKEMVAKWWNNKDEAPKTAEPTIEKSEEEILINCTTEGASIVYKTAADDDWTLYTGTFPAVNSDSIYVVAHRIGFQPSRKTFPNN